MELETYIIEEDVDMELEDVQQILDDYLEAKKTFMYKISECKNIAAELDSKKLITSKEKNNSNKLYDDLKEVHQKSLDAKSTLLRKIEDLIIDCKSLESELALSEMFFEDDSLKSAQELLNQAIELKGNGDELPSAIERVYQAKHCLAELLEGSSKAWLNNFQEKISTLASDTKI